MVLQFLSACCRIFNVLWSWFFYVRLMVVADIVQPVYIAIRHVTTRGKVMRLLYAPTLSAYRIGS